MDREAGALRRAGKRVFLIEPSANDLRIMGFNYMSRRRLDQVAAAGQRTTVDALRAGELGTQLRTLPRGAPVRLRRPDSDPSAWPKDLFPPERRSATVTVRLPPRSS